MKKYVVIYPKKNQNKKNGIYIYINVRNNIRLNIRTILFTFRINVKQNDAPIVVKKNKNLLNIYKFKKKINKNEQNTKSNIRVVPTYCILTKNWKITLLKNNSSNNNKI